jgi:chitinase
MKFKYPYTIEDGFYVSHLDDYSEYVTQGGNRGGFENAVREIYRWIADGTLTAKEQIRL